MSNYSLSKLLNRSSINKLFDIFNYGLVEICLVGGCVRDALLDIEAKDIDAAVNIPPEQIIHILNKNNIPSNKFAYKYGSIVSTIDNQKIQITSLREDINQRGRDTNIIFTNDWKQDALRRDFTINAIYLKHDGTTKDFFNGQKDLLNSELKFIGKIEERIQEDFLRIFRYYRFLGIYLKPQINIDDEKILIKFCKESFNYIPNDLLRQEILKMFNNSFPLNSFYDDINHKEKKYWIELTKKHFIKTKYDLGLNKCLNKIDMLIN